MQSIDFRTASMVDAPLPQNRTGTGKASELHYRCEKDLDSPGSERFNHASGSLHADSYGASCMTIWKQLKDLTSASAKLHDVHLTDRSQNRDLTGPRHGKCPVSTSSHAHGTDRHAAEPSHHQHDHGKHQPEPSRRTEESGRANPDQKRPDQIKAPEAPDAAAVRKQQLAERQMLADDLRKGKHLILPDPVHGFDSLYKHMAQTSRYISFGAADLGDDNPKGDMGAFMRSLPGLKAGGITHVGIESLRSDTETGKHIQAYKEALADPSKDESEAGAQLARDIESAQPGMPPEFYAARVKMIGAALKLKLEVFGLEPAKPDDFMPALIGNIHKKLSQGQEKQFDAFFSHDLEKAAQAGEALKSRLTTDDIALLDQAKKLGYDFSGAPLGADMLTMVGFMNQKTLERRNAAAAAQVDKIFQGPGGDRAKVVTYSGAWHVGTTPHHGWGAEGVPTISTLVAEKGYKTTITGFGGGTTGAFMLKDRETSEQENPGSPLKEMSMGDILTSAARDAGLSDREFAVRLRDGSVFVHMREPRS